MHRVDPELARHRLGDRPRVPGEHRDLDAHLVEPPDRLRRLGPHRVRDRERRDRPALLDEEHDGLTRAPRPSRENSSSSGGRRDAEPAEQVRPAHHPLPPVHARPHAVAGDRLEPSACGIARPRSARGAHHRLRDRVLGVALHRGGDAERLLLGRARVSLHADDPVLAERERPGLVEDDRGEVARLLEPSAIPDQQAGPRPEGRRDRDDERDREAERMRAGDDQDRNDALHDERPRRARDPPCDRGDERPPRARRSSA